MMPEESASQMEITPIQEQGVKLTIWRDGPEITKEESKSEGTLNVEGPVKGIAERTHLDGLSREDGVVFEHLLSCVMCWRNICVRLLTTSWIWFLVCFPFCF